MIPLMSISRNFFLGSEPTKRPGPAARATTARPPTKVTREALKRMGIDLRDTRSRSARSRAASASRWRSPGRSTSGRRSSSSTSRRPRSASRRPASSCASSRRPGSRGIGVIFITHNVNHAYLVGDRFSILDRGAGARDVHPGRARRRPSSLELMGGGAELKELEHELEGVAGVTIPPAPPADYLSEQG